MNIISDLFGVKVAYAGNLDSFLVKVNQFILNPLITLLFALAFVVFLYGVVMFIANQENETERTTGKKHMIWGLVGLVIMFSVWAIINLLVSTFKLEQDVNPGSPNVSNSVNLHDFINSYPNVGPPQD